MTPVPPALADRPSCAGRANEPREPQGDPAAAHTDSLDPPAAGECWSALYTRSRREKQVARACLHHRVRHYLPLREHRTGTVRCRVYQVPLFPSYVFACLAPLTRVALLETGAVVRVIQVPRPRLLLEELRQIRAALASGADLVPGRALERGMRVRVINGLLRGIEGLVADRWFRRGRARLVLNVTFLGRGAAVEIDARDVEPIDTPAHGDGAAGAVAGAMDGFHVSARADRYARVT